MNPTPTPLREEAAPAPMSAERLADIKRNFEWDGYCYHHSDSAQLAARQLLAENENLRRALSLEKQRAAGLEAAFLKADDMAWTDSHAAWKHIREAFRPTPDELE